MAFRVQGELSMDGSKFFGVMGQAGAAVNRFGNSVTQNIGGRLAAAFSVGAITMAARRTMEYADSIEELSQKLGVSTDKLQEWDFAAKQNGATVSTLGDFIMKLSRAAQDVGNVGAFKAKGINPAGMTNEGLFQSVQSQTKGKSFNEINKIMTDLGMDAKSFRGVINVLQSDLDASGEAARKMGAVIDQSTISALAALNDQLSIVGQVLMGQFAPVLVEAGIAVLKMIGGVKLLQAEIAERLGSKIEGQRLKSSGASAQQQKNLDRLGKALEAKGLSNEEIIKELSKYSLSNTTTGSVEGDVNAAQKEILDKFNAMIAAIQNRKQPELPTIGEATVGERKTAAKISSDSLVSVGNFLGTNRESIASLAKRQVELLTKIERNTRPSTVGEDDYGFPL